MLFAVGETAHDDAREAVLALEPQEKILESDHIEDEPAGPMRLDLAPMLAARGRNRRLDNAVILGASGIGEDDEASLVVFDAVIVLGLAGRDEAGRGARIGRIDEADLGGFVVVDAEQKVAAVLRRADAEEVAGVGLVVHETVGRIATDRVAQQTARAVLVVEPNIEEVAAVGAPFERAVAIGDARVDELAGVCLDHVDGVVLRALGIDGIGHEPVVGTVRGVGDVEIGMGRRKRIAVDEDPLIAAVAGDAAEEGMLPTFDIAPVIGEVAVGLRHACVVFLDAALHLGEQFRL